MSYRSPYAPRRLYRSDDSVFFGVCAGISEYFDFKLWAVRLFFVLLQFTVVPFMFVIYFILALVMKRAPRYYYERY